MTFLRRLVVSLLILLLLLLAAGLFLPKTAHVERSVVINAPAETIFPLIADFKAWERWSPWYGIDPDTVYTYEGSGLGARTSWTSEERSVGSGSQEITAINPPNSMNTALDFGAEGPAQAYFTLAPEGSGTRVTWGFDTDFTNSYIGRYFGLVLDRMLGGPYETGLANLKKLAESS